LPIFPLTGIAFAALSFAFAGIGFKVLHRIASESFKTCLGDADPENPRLVSRR
jgi:hypothetical protein